MAQNSTSDFFVREYNGLATVLNVISFGGFPLVESIVIDKNYNSAYGDGSPGAVYKNITASDNIYDLSLPEYEITFIKGRNCLILK